MNGWYIDCYAIDDQWQENCTDICTLYEYPSYFDLLLLFIRV